MSQTTTQDPIRGTAAGVPFLAVPPSEAKRASAPVVVAWHLFDAPRTETAFAAALPLDGLDAWRIYLGLPLAASRLPAGGWDELIRLGYDDAVLNIHKPVIYGGAEEFRPAYDDLRRRLGVGDGPIGLLGGSYGSAVAQLVMAHGDLPVNAAVLVSPVVQLRQAVQVLSRQFGVTYRWSDETNAIADRLDFLARAADIADRGRPAVLLVAGENDDPEFREPAADLADTLRRRYGSADRSDFVLVAGMGHALADEPGIEPAPQTPHAAVVDRHAVRWFRRHLR